MAEMRNSDYELMYRTFIIASHLDDTPFLATGTSARPFLALTYEQRRKESKSSINILSYLAEAIFTLI